MTAVAMSDCVGLWRRTLLIESDGSHDTGTDVTWLQGITAYVDSRGFAGTLSQHDDVFEWNRAVDLTPPGPPDAGSMRWQDGVLVETGVHADYAEHWERDGDGVTPCGALFLTAPDGRAGLLLRVGGLFGWAGGDEVSIGDVNGTRWQAIDFDADFIQDNGVRWTITGSEGDMES